jgi:uncharacterized lipoprotein YddW (UPF0748 family)
MVLYGRFMNHLPRLAHATVVVAALYGLTIIGAAGPSASEVRALWVTRASLSSPETIQQMVASASAHGFNTLFVQVRGRGDAYYNRGLEVRSPALASQSAAFDPLADTLARAREAGLRVHAWVNVNLVSSATELPASREHVIYEHPEWLMVPRELGPELLAIEPRSPEYLGRLARWTRANTESVEGLYVSPVHAGAHEHIVSIVADLVTRYAVDGIHLDYVRYPRADFDYSREAVRAFETDMRAQVAPAERARVTALLRVAGGVSGRVATLPPVAPDRPCHPCSQHRRSSASRGDRERRGRARCRGRRQREAAGLAHVAGERLRRRALPHGVHAGRDSLR